MKLTYIMDPQCGWCYGNSSNILKLQEKFGKEIEFEILVGGMWLGQDAPKGGAELSSFLKNHAPRMSQTTGAEVSEAYYQLALDSSYSFSSLEPSAALVLFLELYPNRVFEFSHNIQKALFVLGKRLDQKETYQEILLSMDIDFKEFEKKWMTATNISAAKKIFNQASSKASGFPTVLLNNQLLVEGYFDYHQVEKILEQKL
ncbi:MAG: DsbA family protein [Flavobacteriales bacterium]|nr:DsbA family protein [Flavobacteriales bacterium]